jgi:hypothetical protein
VLSERGRQLVEALKRLNWCILGHPRESTRGRGDPLGRSRGPPTKSLRKLGEMAQFLRPWLPKNRKIPNESKKLARNGIRFAHRALVAREMQGEAS